MKHSVYGARAFYFSMYFGFYVSVVMYPNLLKDYLKNGDYFWFFFYLALHSASVFYFLTAARNPGYLVSDEESLLYKVVNSSEDS